jgi:hypothetical protein
MKLIFRFLAFSLLLVLVACGGSLQKNESNSNVQEPQKSTAHSFNNGTFCSRIVYFNPNTNTRSEYFLTAHVENQTLVRVDFNEESWLDGDHFTPPSVTEDGSANFVSDKGYHYSVQLLEDETICQNSHQLDRQCKGKTKSGERCKHHTANENGYCHQHQSQAGN